MTTFSTTSIFPLQVVREFYSMRMEAREDIEMGLEFGEDKYISLAIRKRNNALHHLFGSALPQLWSTDVSMVKTNHLDQ